MMILWKSEFRRVFLIDLTRPREDGYPVITCRDVMLELMKKETKTLNMAMVTREKIPLLRVGKGVSGEVSQECMFGLVMPFFATNDVVGD